MGQIFREIWLTLPHCFNYTLYIMAFTGIKAVFVDIDDTLWWFGKNSEIALKHTFGIFHLERWCSYERFHDLYRAHNGRLWERYHHGEIGKDFLLSERFRLPLAEVGCDEISDELLSQLNEEYLTTLSSLPTLMPWGREMLDYLTAKGYEIGVVSNGFISTQEPKLKAAGVREYIKHLIISEEIGYTKPMREIFDHALRCCGLQPHEVVMIGDNFDADIRGAHNAGWRTIFFNPRNLPAGTEADAIITHLSQVVELL